jgi:hypothetical protein
MPQRKQINSKLEKILIATEAATSVEVELDEYKKLNEKCDIVITKIKNRKSKVKEK